jgi:hypothetical protein
MNIEEIVNHVYEETPEVIRAGSLAQWLITTKDVKPKQAYIIAARKNRVKFWQDVSKYYNQKLKPKQMETKI